MPVGGWEDPSAWLDEVQRDDLQLWAYFGAYDHVALCQLWGRMIDLPAFVPMYTNDLMQTSRAYGVDRLAERVPRPAGDEHDALGDARWNAAAFRFLEQHARERGYFRRPMPTGWTSKTAPVDM